MEKCGAATGAINENTVRCMRLAGWMSKVTRAQAHAHTYATGHPRARARTHTHTQMCNTYCCSTASGFANASQYYVIRSLSVLLYINSVRHILYHMVYSVAPSRRMSVYMYTGLYKINTPAHK